MDNETKSFISSSYGDEKLSKAKELNSNMSIRANGQDDLTSRLNTLGGNN